MQTLTQRDLYASNRRRLQAPMAPHPDIDVFERDWIGRSLSGADDGPLPQSLAELRAALKERIAAEQARSSDGAAHVAEHMPIEEFRILVQEFAVDGLTEAQVFYYALPRLPLEAQMPLLRIMIDEFGSGNIRRAHTTLYIDLLRELSMPMSLDFYIDRIGTPSFEFVNVFFWLALRADDVSYFAGALTYLETTIPAFFDCYARACRRLNVTAHAYYTEHQHIDGFHAIEGQRLLAAMNGCGVLHAGKAYQGALLASFITERAFENAVVKAKASVQ